MRRPNRRTCRSRRPPGRAGPRPGTWYRFGTGSRPFRPGVTGHGSWRSPRRQTPVDVYGGTTAGVRVRRDDLDRRQVGSSRTGWHRSMPAGDTRLRTQYAKEGKADAERVRDAHVRLAGPVLDQSGLGAPATRPTALSPDFSAYSRRTATKRGPRSATARSTPLTAAGPLNADSLGQSDAPSADTSSHTAVCQDRACWGRLGLAQVGVRSAGASA